MDAKPTTSRSGARPVFDTAAIAMIGVQALGLRMAIDVGQDFFALLFGLGMVTLMLTEYRDAISNRRAQDVMWIILIPFAVYFAGGFVIPMERLLETSLGLQNLNILPTGE